MLLERDDWKETTFVDARKGDLKVDALTSMGVKVSRRVPHLVQGSQTAMRYLATKGERMGHMLDGPLAQGAPDVMAAK